jgi:hypothetical protein
MSHKKRAHTPEYQWEHALLDAYDDFRWQQVLEPLYDQFQRWTAGELDHAEMDKAIHQTHKETQELYGVFTLKREILVRAVQLDEDLFQDWVRENPPPSG